MRADIKISGLQLWKTTIPNGVGNSLVFDNEQGLYTINKLGNLYKFDVISGEVSLVSALNFTSDILIDSDGNLYVGSGEFLYALDSEGNILCPLWYLVDMSQNCLALLPENL